MEYTPRQTACVQEATRRRGLHLRHSVLTNLSYVKRAFMRSKSLLLVEYSIARYVVLDMCQRLWYHPEQLI